MNYRKWVAVIVTGATISLESAPVPQPILGAGVQGCGQWVSVERDRTLRETTLRAILISWVQGFVSGSLAATSTNASELRERVPDEKSLGLWLSNYCRQHPLDDLAAAAGGLVKELIGR